MNAFLRKMLFSFAVIIYRTVAIQEPLSPCPEFFRYQFDGTEWFGLVEVPISKSLIGQTIRLRINLSLKAHLPTKDYGSVATIGQRSEVLSDILQGNNVKYKIQFPVPFPIPKLTSIILNNQIICTGQAEIGRVVTAIQLENNLYTEAAGQALAAQNQRNFDYSSNNLDNSNHFEVLRPAQSIRPVLIERQNFQQSFQQNSIADHQICGRPAPPINALIMNGVSSSRGSWPWLVALYTSKDQGLQFRCGATLIASNVILTAGHCVTDEQNRRTFSVSDVVLFIGRNNIADWTEENFVTAQARQIQIHPDFRRRDSTNFDADIAVIQLKHPVRYSHFIRPICLWPPRDNIQDVEGQKGVVVGWGRDEFGSIMTKEPKMVQVPIVSEAQCLRADESFRYLSSNRTFCAGGEGKGPCNGDSGSGLVLKRNGRWTLRGIVSVSLLNPETKLCDVDSYIVFTDVAKFFSWIKRFLD